MEENGEITLVTKKVGKVAMGKQSVYYVIHRQINRITTNEISFQNYYALVPPLDMAILLDFYSC